MKLKSPALLLVFFIAVTLVPAVLPQAHCADVLTHVTTGSQEIKGQNLPGAKQKAVKLALEQAVQQAFAKLVSREVFASNLEFLYSRLLPSAQDYVVTYRVLDGIEYNGQYLVGVESKINLGLVEKRLKDARIIKTGQEKPVVLILIAEETLDTPQPLHWWGTGAAPFTSSVATAIRTRLEQDRIPFARAAATYPDPASHNIVFASPYDAKAAMDLGQALKADLVILGKAAAAESANRMGDERAFDAHIDLTVYDVKTQALVIRTTAKATAKSEVEYQGAAQALDQAAASAGEDLAKQIDTFWSRTLRQEKQFDLTIEGENFLTRFIALKRRMRDIRDIENIQPREIGSNSAVMEVTFKGSSRQFADALLLKTFDGFGIEIAEVTDEQVSIRFTEAGGQAEEETATQPGAPTAVTQEKIEN
ncbi:MAG: hypothetical protein HUN04_15800 [Desulfobacter sp.]|nr:MAG: hypothetical protein HUN04_15800 [Desulfobacter sp.]